LTAPVVLASRLPLWLVVLVLWGLLSSTLQEAQADSGSLISVLSSASPETLLVVMHQQAEELPLPIPVQQSPSHPLLQLSAGKKRLACCSVTITSRER